jgi:capping protein beta
MESREKILACLNILKRLPPTNIQKNADALATLIPDYAEELYQRIDKPLGKIIFSYPDLGTDTKNGNLFITSEFNRDGDSFRSHISNQYFPPLDDAVFPSENLRSLEEKANILFDEYKKL